MAGSSTPQAMCYVTEYAAKPQVSSDCQHRSASDKLHYQTTQQTHSSALTDGCSGLAMN